MYEIGREELNALESLFQSRKLFRYQGPGVDTQTTIFEKEFSQSIQQGHSLIVTSGTNSLILALEAIGVGEGDEVIIPSYTFVATLNAVLHVKATPVIAGITSSFSLDPESVKALITSKTKAVIMVHMDGLPGDLQGLQSVLAGKTISLIEDVAQSVGGSFRNKPLGSFGEASCFSFNVDKIISCGEGGAVAFKSETHFKKALKNHDGPVSFGATYRDYLSDIPPAHGHSMRISEISSVIMREQLKRLPAIITHLRERKNIWKKSLPVIESSDPSGDCGTTVHLDCGDPARAALLAQSLTKNGILAVPLYTRPAHCYWQWLPLLNLPEPDLKLLNFRLSQDKMRISSTIRIAVDYRLDLPETGLLVEKARELMR